MDDPLEVEWAQYRAACDRVDEAQQSLVRDPRSSSEIELANAVWERGKVATAYAHAVSASALRCAARRSSAQTWSGYARCALRITG